MKQKKIYLLVGRPSSAVRLSRKPDLLQHIPARDTEHQNDWNKTGPRRRVKGGVLVSLTSSSPPCASPTEQSRMLLSQSAPIPHTDPSLLSLLQLAHSKICSFQTILWSKKERKQISTSVKQWWRISALKYQTTPHTHKKMLRVGKR